MSIDQEGAVAAARGLGAVSKQLEGKEVGPTSKGSLIHRRTRRAPCACSTPGLHVLRLARLVPIRCAAWHPRPAGEEGHLCSGQDSQHHRGQVTARRCQAGPWRRPPRRCSPADRAAVLKMLSSQLIGIGMTSNVLASVTDIPPELVEHKRGQQVAPAAAAALPRVGLHACPAQHQQNFALL